MTERAEVLVAGGGIVGVSAAWFLAERGVQVTLIDQGEIGSGCSYGNAGWIFPSHSTPLPGPGVFRDALRWVGHAESPLYIRPRLDPALLRWLWRFGAACTESRLQRAFGIRRALSVASHALYRKLAALPGLDLGYEQQGLLVVCETPRGLEEAKAEVGRLEALGGRARLLDAEAVRELAPAVATPVAGGVLYPDDAHVTPHRVVNSLARAAQQRGVRLRPGCEVISVEVAAGRLRSVHTTRGEFSCEHLVLATGAWTPQLARPLGLRLPIQPAKGYSVTIRRPAGFVDVPLMLSEAKVGITPLGDRLRFAGTLELAGLDLTIRVRRVEAILAAVRRVLRGLGELERLETWRGLRPLTPDDLPIIGRPRGFANLILATGHGMSGMCQGPITGELVAQLVCGETPQLDLAPLSPDRFRGPGLSRVPGW